MNKSLLALAVFGAFASAAQAQSSVTLYGLVDSGVRYDTAAPVGTTANDSQTRFISGVLSTSRYGFKGSEDLGNGLKANFTLEGGFNAVGASSQNSAATGTASLFDRKATVGLSGAFGSVDLGRNFNAGYTFAAMKITDANGLAYDGVLATTMRSAPAATAGSAANGSAIGNIKLNPVISVVSNTNLGTTRSDNQLRYDGKFGDVQAIATYGIGGTAGDAGQKESYSGGFAWVGKPVRLAASAYHAQNGTAAKKKLEYYSVGGDILIDAFTFTASYNELKADKGYTNNTLAVATAAVPLQDGVTAANGSNKFKVSHLGLTYQASPALKGILAYYESKYEATGMAQDGKTDTVILTGIYSLSKRTDLYFDVDHAQSKDAAKATGGQDTNTGVTVGIRHNF
jgi:predicted porin